ncbi:MAG: hypothetical protein HPY69_17140 [Armatimonadetes bacterium]|nr:hypothetical protein [Armatimonadota bacterium]
MQRTTFPEGTHEAIARVAAELERKAAALQAQADKAREVYCVWDRICTLLSQGWAMHLLNTLHTERLAVEQVVSDSPDLANLVHELQTLAEEKANAVMRDYPSLLEHACSAASLPLDRTSRHPKYTFEQGFFELAVDEGRRLAVVSNYEARLAKLPADVEAVVKTVEKEHRRVFGRRFEGLRVLKSLRKQYLAIINKEGRVDGDPVPIRHITRRLGKNVKGFRTDEFLVDLSRLVMKGPFEIEGRRLDLQQTRDTSQGMLLHDVSGHGYIGFVLFRRVE